MAGLWLYLVVLAWSQIVRFQHLFILDDWLISYAGGPVRRGLGGSVLMWVATVTGLPVSQLVAGVIALLMAVTFYHVARLSRGGGPAVWLLLASPAVFLFSAYDPDGAFRKEWLLYALLAICLSQMVRGRGQFGIAGFAVGAPLITLAHEGLAVFLPYGLTLLAASPAGKGTRLWIAFAVCSVAGALALAYTFPGEVGQIQSICAALSRWPELALAGNCPGTGAISWLAHGHTPPALYDGAQWAEVRAWMVPAVGVTVLGFLPAAAKLFRNRRAAWVVAGFILSVVASIPLFWIAADWGRFVHIHATCLALCVLGVLGAGPRPEPPTGRMAVVWAGCIVVYATTWHLHHYRQPFIPVPGVVHLTHVTGEPVHE